MLLPYIREIKETQLVFKILSIKIGMPAIKSLFSPVSVAFCL